MFSDWIPALVLQHLRAALRIIGPENADSYRSHAFRRGHARDMARNGATLAEIFRAGEWRSAAFMDYLDQQELEDAAIMEAHLDESSGDELENSVASIAGSAESSGRSSIPEVPICPPRKRTLGLVKEEADFMGL